MKSIRTITIITVLLVSLLSFTNLNSATEVQTSKLSTLDIHDLLVKQKTLLQADGIIAVVMESKTGKIVSMESANRLIPNTKYNEENAIEYSHEQGGVMKPIIFSLLLDKGLVFPNELIDCHDGNYTLGAKTIIDENKFKILTAEDVIVYSSNIGMVQIVQRISGKEYEEGLDKFGFGRFSGIDIQGEKSGSIPTSTQLDFYLYKAIVSYGYGVNANLLQMVKAFNAFNNNGRMVTPKLHESNKIQSSQVISPSAAQRMKQILIKTVNEGTGAIAKTQGLEIGGKTGSAFITKDEKYIDNYNTNFIGFANDDKNSYTIGITVINPQSSYSSSSTAGGVFKAIVEAMVQKKYLEPR